MASPLDAALDLWSARQKAAEVGRSVKASRDQKLAAKADVAHYWNRLRDVSGFSESKAKVADNELSALIEIFEATNGFGWRRQGGWVGRPGTRHQPEVPYFAVSASLWEGVSLNETNESVEALNLECNNLEGTFCEAFARLRALKICRLQLNDLSGPLCKLSASLTDLNLAANRLNGSLEVLRDLSSIKRLDVSRNQFSGPFQLEALSDKLEHVDVSGNRDLSGEVSLACSVALISLLVADNRFSGCIECSNCKQLTLLDASVNQFTRVSLETLPVSMVELRLHHNCLEGPLRNLCDGASLSNLQVLLLNDNQFSGFLPSAIADIAPNLRVANLSHNNLSGPVPKAVANLKRLRCLDLSFNPRLDGGPNPLGLERLSDLVDFAGADGLPSLTLGRQRRFDTDSFRIGMQFQYMYDPNSPENDNSPLV